MSDPTGGKDAGTSPMGDRGLGILLLLLVAAEFLLIVLGPSILAGLGFGGSIVPITIAAVSGVPVGEAGLASGLINTTQQVGSALGLGSPMATASPRSSQT